MNPPVTAALIALVGVVVGLIGRDVIMAIFLAHQKRGQETKDKKEALARDRRSLVRLYADPLREAAKSLRFRLDEIIESGSSRYLLTQTPRTSFVDYKRISTVYRLAVLLGWIRAFRRERSYLDPDDTSPVDSSGDPISEIEKALADGQHVEEQRLNELLNLWKVPRDKIGSGTYRSPIAAEIDGKLREFLTEKGCLSASDLKAVEKIELARHCARLVADRVNVEIPQELVDACAEQASVFFGIKEAYIYRDWQAALGDMMICEISGALRRFDVIGFGEFESRYLQMKDAASSDGRWISRLEKLFHDLDMTKTGMFDARRQQLKNLHAGCKLLEERLDKKISELRKPS